MKINFIYFSCLRDFKSLYYSVSSVLKLFPKSEIHIFIKEFINIKPFHENVKFHQYNIENNKNLNGESFVAFFIRTAKKISRNCDYVAKIDSDVLMFNNEKFLSFCDKGYSLIGKENIIKDAKKGVLPYASGGFYLINSKTLTKIKLLNLKRQLRILDKKEHNDKRWAEDERVASFIKSVDDNILLQKPLKDDVSVLGFWPYQTLQDEIDKTVILHCRRCFDTVEFGRVNIFKEDEKFQIRNQTIKKVFNH